MTTKISRILCVCILAAVWAGSASNPAHANIIGQKRFLPLHQASQKQKQAIIVPLSEQPSAPQNIQSVSRSKFLPIRRDVMTIRRNVNAAIHPAAISRARQQGASERKPTINAASKPPAASGSRSVTSDSVAGAMVELFDGDQKILASHPFMK